MPDRALEMLDGNRSAIRYDETVIDSDVARFGSPKIAFEEIGELLLGEDSERDRELAISRKEVNLFTARFYDDSKLANLPGTHLRVPGTRDVPKRSRASLVKACTFRLLRS